MFSPKITTTCLMAAEAVVGVITTGGGAVDAGWLLLVLQPLRISEDVSERAASFDATSSFRIMVRNPSGHKVFVPPHYWARRRLQLCTPVERKMNNAQHGRSGATVKLPSSKVIQCRRV